jgi:23S rRNA pseudouridine1911/1915/1917 synthase
LIHRLDTFTSGLIVAARTDTAFRALKRCLTSGELSKRYQAVVEARGLPDRGQIEGALRPRPGRRRRVEVLPPSDARGRPAATRFSVVTTRSRWALLEVTVGAAYRHQIRAHLASIGHPIAGDGLYGGPTAAGLAPERHALHAAYVACAAEGIERFAVETALPEDMRRLLDGD